ncbi:hypothetical protein [Helicobacter pylori]|uniref:hypothetical protein n=1 Tax=Helicobacter pylori TaxID=210 RepID=UPI001AE3D14C|nr:hypothetical protein [Helicobacter pylori]QTP06424.1 hypothetical protein J4T92_00410 [Helicobacter pylori]WQU39955.1 hypothetical protein KVE42_00410 [Helicobacter pylori]
MAIWGIEINPQHQRVIAKTLRDIFIYSKNDSFKVVGDTLAMNTPFKESFILAFVRVL